MTAIFTEHRSEPPIDLNLLQKMPPASGGCRGRMVELVAGAGELVLQALFSRETILKQANQIGVEYVETRSVRYVAYVTGGYEVAETVVCYIITFAPCTTCGTC